jgi:squalene monooxygenase
LSEDCLEGIDAIPVYGYEVIYRFEPVHIPYPQKLKSPEGKKPEGRSFHHGRFIQKLRRAASDCPNVTLIESTVTSLVKNEWTGQILGVEAKTRGEKEYVRYFSLDREIVYLQVSSSPALLRLSQTVTLPT